MLHTYLTKPLQAVGVANISFPQVFDQILVGLSSYPENVFPHPVFSGDCRYSGIPVVVQGYLLLDACYMTTYKYVQSYSKQYSLPTTIW
jgi:hypothetical protein